MADKQALIDLSHAMAVGKIDPDNVEQAFLKSMKIPEKLWQGTVEQHSFNAWLKAHEMANGLSSGPEKLKAAQTLIEFASQLPPGG